MVECLTRWSAKTQNEKRKTPATFFSSSPGTCCGVAISCSALCRLRALGAISPVHKWNNFVLSGIGVSSAKIDTQTSKPGVCCNIISESYLSFARQRFCPLVYQTSPELARRLYITSNSIAVRGRPAQRRQGKPELSATVLSFRIRQLTFDTPVFRTFHNQRLNLKNDVIFTGI